MERTGSINDEPQPDGCCAQCRNRVGFWFLGLCNNFAYVVMLSAAHDILQKQESKNSTASTSEMPIMDRQAENSTNSSSRYDCSPVTTGAVLLADVVPTLVIKLIAPFVIHKVPYGFRVLLCAAMAATSFLLVSFSSAVWMSIIGVIFASLSSGLGELSFLSLSVFFNRNVLEGWGSGTGGAGVAGALLYSALIQVGVSPQVTLLIMLVVPFILLFSYFGVLLPSSSLPQWSRVQIDYRAVDSEETQQLMDDSDQETSSSSPSSAAAAEDRSVGHLTCREKRNVIKNLVWFVLPLGVVYCAEYFINQGLMELLFFPNFFLPHAEQYRWYQTTYQIGVFVSRSSLACVKIRKVWIFSILQVINAIFLLFAVRYLFLSSAWWVFVIIFYEGLLGGAAYVNTFHFISKKMEDRHREFAMAMASVGDSLGIAVAGFIAFPVHSYFCSLL